MSSVWPTGPMISTSTTPRGFSFGLSQRCGPVLAALRASDGLSESPDILYRVGRLLGRSVTHASLKAVLPDLAIADGSTVQRVGRVLCESDGTR